MKNLIILIVSIISTISCNSQMNISKQTIDHKKWVLQTIENSDVSDSDAFFVIENDKISGNAPCNRFGGSVEFDSKKIKAGALMSTKMFCSGKTKLGMNLSKVESLFLENIRKSTNYKIVKNKLFLYDNSDRELLSFEVVGKCLR